MNGDHFGEIDFYISAKEQDMTIAEMMDKLNIVKFNMVRQFTIQAIRDSYYLTMNISNIQRMHKQFNSQFKDLFRNAKRTLFRSLEQKAKSIKKIDNQDQVLSLFEYAKTVDPEIRQQVLSEFEKEQLDQELGLKTSTDEEAKKKVKQVDMMKEVNALFYRGTKNLSKIRDGDTDDESSYQTSSDL